MTMESIILSSVAIYTLYRLNFNSKAIIYRDKQFWISIGVVTYFGGNLLLFAFGYLIETEFFNSAWIIHSGLNILANLFYAGGFLCLHPRLSIGGS